MGGRERHRVTVRRADMPPTNRGDAAAATWMFRSGRGDAAAATWMFRLGRGDAAAATWICPWKRVAATPRPRRGYARGEESRRRRGRDVDMRVDTCFGDAAVATWMFRTGRGDAAAATWRVRKAKTSGRDARALGTTRCRATRRTSRGTSTTNS